jgi:phosphohistidine phosphatase
MEIYLLRHGLAEDRETWDKDDALRPLTKQGKRITQLSAETMAALELKPNWIITSPLVRAYQTAEIVARRLSLMDKLVQDERLGPGFSLPHMEQILEAYPYDESVMFVGHEPDFSETLSDLIGGGSLVFKKGGLARVSILSRSPLSGELIWLVPPKLLAR